jgi:hypothetical protein
MTEPKLGPSPAGSVVLDIGGDTGALILHTPAEMLGREIDVTPASAPGAHGTHSLVRERRVSGTTSYAAVYPALPAGDYIIWRDRATPVGTVTITGGQVTRHHWPS